MICCRTESTSLELSCKFMMTAGIEDVIQERHRFGRMLPRYRIALGCALLNGTVWVLQDDHGHAQSHRDSSRDPTSWCKDEQVEGGWLAGITILQTKSSHDSCARMSFQSRRFHVPTCLSKSLFDQIKMHFHIRLCSLQNSQSPLGRLTTFNPYRTCAPSDMLTVFSQQHPHCDICCIPSLYLLADRKTLSQYYPATARFNVYPNDISSFIRFKDVQKPIEAVPVDLY